MHKATSKLSPVVSIKKRQDFKKVFNKGKYSAGALFVIHALKNGLDESRLGLSVSKKVGNAVVRNRVKRLVKEVCRLMLIPAGYDFVIVARVPAGEMGEDAFVKVRNSLIERFGKLGFTVDKL